MNWGAFLTQWFYLQQYALKEKEEKSIVTTEPTDVKEPENLVQTASEEVAIPPTEVPPTDVTPLAAEESSDATTNEPPVEKAEEVTAAAGAIEENTDASKEGNLADAEAAEEAPEIKVVLLWDSILCDIYLQSDSSVILKKKLNIVSLPVHSKYLFQLETAPADFRFPTSNQTRHCFTRYIEYHR